MNGTSGEYSISEKVRERLDRARPFLGAVFLAAYAGSSFVPDTPATTVLLVSGIVLYAMSVPWASAFHRGLAVVAFAVLGLTIATGEFDAGAFFGGLPAYFDVAAVLLILSAAGYPIRAARYEAQVQGLVSAARRKGIGTNTTAGGIGHILGAALDVGSFVLVDVVARRAAPESRVDALTWAGRAFSFAPLWTNLNLLTATTITLTGTSYTGFLSLTLPFVVLGMATTLFFAQREKEEPKVPDEPSATLDRGAAAVLLYPALLVVAVAVVNTLLPAVPLTAAIAITVAAMVVVIAVIATVLTKRTSPVRRLGREARDSLASSHPEVALFGSAGVLVLSLTQIGALAPVGEVLSSLPTFLVPMALALTMAVGFVVGIHVIPMAFLIDTAFPLDGGSSPALWAAAIMLGAQSALLLTPFSSAVTMLSRLSGLHPLEIGPKRNWRFGLAVALGAVIYLTALTLLLI
ncbi:MAG: hypothetical protein H0V83_04675 [Rubrobacter sp.]|nr:hypothetical protein [Rubrobacter sp.]